MCVAGFFDNPVATDRRICMKKKKLSFVRAFFAVFFGIPLLAAIVAWILTSDVSSLLEPKELVSRVVENIDVSTLKASDLTEEAEEGQTVAEFITEQIVVATGEKLKFSDADLENLLLLIME